MTDKSTWWLMLTHSRPHQQGFFPDKKSKKKKKKKNLQVPQQ